MPTKTKASKPAAKKSTAPSIASTYDVTDDGENYLVIKKATAAQQPIAIIPYETRAGDGSPSKLQALAKAKFIASVLTEDFFAASFKHLAEKAHATALSKGWWKTEDAILSRLAGYPDLINAFLLAQDGKNIALFTSEASEALEAMRHNNPPDDKIPAFSGVEAELADVIIRIMDVSQRRGWRVGEAVVAKMAFNAGRPAMHGGKKF